MKSSFHYRTHAAEAGADLVDPSNKRRIDIQPTHWRKWTERRAKGV
jgi:hypothetical protein